MVMRNIEPGPMKTLLSVVALDDVVGIILFGIAMSLKVSVSGEALSAVKIITGQSLKFWLTFIDSY